MTTLTISDSPADTMRLAMLGPRWSEEYTAAQEAARNAAYGSLAESDAEAIMQRLDGEQIDGEADYGRRWAENVRAIAARRGYDVTVIVSDDAAAMRWTSTGLDNAGIDEYDVRSVEEIIWQEAHDATDLPDGW